MGVSSARSLLSISKRQDFRGRAQQADRLTKRSAPRLHSLRSHTHTIASEPGARLERGRSGSVRYTLEQQRGRKRRKQKHKQRLACSGAKFLAITDSIPRWADLRCLGELECFQFVRATVDSFGRLRHLWFKGTNTPMTMGRWSLIPVSLLNTMTHLMEH